MPITINTRGDVVAGEKKVKVYMLKPIGGEEQTDWFPGEERLATEYFANELERRGKATRDPNNPDFLAIKEAQKKGAKESK